MKIEYYSEDDILVVKLGKEPYDYAEMQDSTVVHYTKEGKPVRIEILDASRFFREEAKVLPAEIKKRYFLSIP